MHDMSDKKAGPSCEGSEEPCGVHEAESDAGSPPADVIRRGGTFQAFRHRAYAIFWSGAMVSNTGTWMQNTALTLLVYSLRRSETDLGLVNFAAGLPTLLFGLQAGVIADRVDRRRLIIWTQAVLMLEAGALGLLFAAGRLDPAHAIEALLWVGGLGVLAGLMSALSFPSWQAIIPDLVPRQTLMNAIALNSAQFQSARLLGPLLAGAMVAGGLTIGDIFWVNAGSFLFVIGAMWIIRPPYAQPLKRAADRPDESSWHTLTAGLRYAREHRAIGIFIISTAMLTVFGMPYMMLAPAIVDKALLPSASGGVLSIAEQAARQVLVNRETTFLLAWNGFGAMVGALVVASLPPTIKREKLARLSLLTLALALVAFSLSRNLYLSFAISAVAGASVLTTNSLINTSIQAQVPHELRGRVLALFIISFLGLMPFSALAFGPLGQAIGPTNAVLGGALVLLAYSAFLLARPSLLEPEQTGAPTPRGR